MTNESGLVEYFHRIVLQEFGRWICVAVCEPPLRCKLALLARAFGRAHLVEHGQLLEIWS